MIKSRLYAVVFHRNGLKFDPLKLYWI